MVFTSWAWNNFLLMKLDISQLLWTVADAFVTILSPLSRRWRTQSAATPGHLSSLTDDIIKRGWSAPPPPPRQQQHNLLWNYESSLTHRATPRKTFEPKKSNYCPPHVSSAKEIAKIQIHARCRVGHPITKFFNLDSSKSKSKAVRLVKSAGGSTSF